MAQPIAKYNGDYITCYPGSNQLDDGKLNLEYNMARIVTRLSSKNFCIVKPSFEIEKITNIDTGAPQLRILKGQASINGMDLIAEDSLVIDPPEKAGKYHLAFKLARDSSWNVLGDFIYGSTTTFEGVYLTYYDNKPDPVDADMLYLGEIEWDGLNFGEIIEDEDKYGRIWAEDILCKIEDPKHPDVRRLNLQEWLYKVPDWYFSKEGDVCYGAAEFLPGRGGIQQPGVKILAVDNTTGKVIVKSPTLPESQANKVVIEGTNTESSISIGTGKLYSTTDNYDLNIDNDTNINLHSKQTLSIQGDQGIEIGSGKSKKDPLLTIKNHKATLTDSNSTDLVYDINFVNDSTIKNTLGKAIWQYTNGDQKVSLLNNNVSALEIAPISNFLQKVRIKEGIFLGDIGLERTYLKPSKWRISNFDIIEKRITFEPNKIIMTNPTMSDSDEAYISVQNDSENAWSRLYDRGELSLQNNLKTPRVSFQDNNTVYDVILEKLIGSKTLKLNGDLNITNTLTAIGSITGNGGLITGNGILTFVKGTNNATITKDNNSTTLRTNGNVYIGQSGTSNLYTGNTTVKGSATIGSSGQFVVDNNGNLNTSGTIRGSKVYNAVYNGIGEIFRKSKDEIIEYGDIVCVKENGLISKVSTVEDLEYIIGICSDTIGFELGGKDIPKDEQVEVEMLGQIWIKTDNKNIKPRSLVKALYNGKVDVTDDKSKAIGITLTDYQNGKVRVYVNGI